ncbi:hypothetical protein UMZ34_16840 [Halopseudomonas pachastrellae]|nr:hypothetical protein UMZ34_16840 [Halopseudomonas pachastrellae]
MAAAGYVIVGGYASGIVLDSYNQVVRDGGEFWRVSAQVSLPYTTTGAGIPEGDALVSVGDAVLRQDLANSTDPAKGAKILGWNEASVSDYLDAGWYTPSGLDLTGVTDESAVVLAALNKYRRVRLPGTPGGSIKLGWSEVVVYFWLTSAPADFKSGKSIKNAQITRLFLCF